MSQSSETSAFALKSLLGEISCGGGLVTVRGKVTAMGSSGYIVSGLSDAVALGEFVSIETSDHNLMAEVVSINQATIVVKPLEIEGRIHLGSAVEARGVPKFFPCEQWKGRVISALAEPLDGKGALVSGQVPAFYTGRPPNAVERAEIDKTLQTGVKAVDVFLPLCYGQRIGIFAGSGVGKSTLMGMLAQARGFDCVVVALVGERGREVSEFVNSVLGDTLSKSIVIVATADETASRRKLAALLATATAERFRDEGQNVLLIMDSVTRFAQALRELALAGGEPAVSRGFPPSVFSALPLMLERAGPGHKGSGTITGIFSVLVEGDNHNEPIADAIRGTLDGHIVLDRQIAASGRFPAVDILASISRLSHKAWSKQQAKVASEMRRLISRFEETKDLRTLGGYQPGADPELDRAIIFVPKLYNALIQSSTEGPCNDPFVSIAEATRN
jgi:flagellum-specific ATP synthase